MFPSKTIHTLLTDEARIHLAAMLRAHEIGPDLVFVVGIDTSLAANRELQGRATCSVEALPRRRALDVYGDLLSQPDIEMLSVRRPPLEVLVLVVAGEEVAVGALPTMSPSSLVAA